VAVVVALAETTVLNVAAVGGVRPDLALIFVFFLAFYGKQDEVFFASWVVGLIKDLFSAGPLGAYALIYAACGYQACRLAQKLFKENPFTQVLVGLPAALMVNAIYLSITLFANPPMEIPALAKSAVICAIYTTALMPPLLFVMSRMRTLLGIRPQPALAVEASPPTE
jgi:rod shape-determining protein MreD